jgi:hypothetical protein
MYYQQGQNQGQGNNMNFDPNNPMFMMMQGQYGGMPNFPMNMNPGNE